MRKSGQQDASGGGAHEQAPAADLNYGQFERSNADALGKQHVPRLHLISDDYGRALIFRGVRIAAAPGDRAPFPVAAVALEEDTNLLMSARAEIRAPAESFGKLVEEMSAFEPAEPGTVVVQGKSPVRLLAIIHDIEQTPSWKEPWVERALSGVLNETERRKLSSLCLPVLGSLHGNMPTARFARLLRLALEQHPPKRLRRIWALVPEEDTDLLLSTFR